MHVFPAYRNTPSLLKLMNFDGELALTNFRTPSLVEEISEQISFLKYLFWNIFFEISFLKYPFNAICFSKNDSSSLDYEYRKYQRVNNWKFKLIESVSNGFYVQVRNNYIFSGFASFIHTDVVSETSPLVVTTILPDILKFSTFLSISLFFLVRKSAIASLHLSNLVLTFLRL